MQLQTALIWKEWRESRIYLFIGLGVFIGLPLIQALESTFQHLGHYVADDTATFVLFFGGLLVIFLAVGQTCRDLNTQLENFWRSRPVGVFRWMLTKYLVGLSTALIVCVVPLLIALSFGHQRDLGADAAAHLSSLAFHWAAVYSVAFALGCLLRKPAHAATLSITAMLMLLGLPTLFVPLQRFDLSVPHQSSSFFISMALIASLGFLAGFLAVVRNWKVDSGMRLIFSAVAGAILLSLLAFTSNLGAALPVDAVAKLPTKPAFFALAVQGNECLLEGNSWRDIRDSEPDYYLLPVQVHDSRLITGVLRSSPPRVWLNGRCLPQDTAVACAAEVIEAPGKSHIHLIKITLVRIDGSDTQLSVEVPAAWEQLLSEYSDHDLWTYDFGRNVSLGLGVWQKDHENNCVRRNATVDLSDIQHPVVISDRPSPTTMDSATVKQLSDAHLDTSNFVINLPQIPGQSAREVLRQRYGVEDDGTYFTVKDSAVVGYQLLTLTDTLAVFKEFNRLERSLFERWRGGAARNFTIYKNGFLYACESAPQPIGSVICVYDTLGTKPMKQVAHFAAPDIRTFNVLADGRLVVASSDKLYLVAAPKRGVK